MLTPCAGCRRHVEETESVCPFCGVAIEAKARIVPVLEGRLSRAAVFASAALVAPACVVNDPPPPRYVRQPPPNDPQPPPPYDPQPPPHDPPPHEARDFSKPPHDRPPPPVADAVVRGQITINGNPMAGIQITLHGGPKPLFVTTDGNGSYYLRLPPGQYHMQVGGAHRMVQAEAGREAIFNIAVAPYVDRSNIPKPYGAPPARRRVV